MVVRQVTTTVLCFFNTSPGHYRLRFRFRSTIGSFFELGKSSLYRNFVVTAEVNEVIGHGEFRLYRV